MKTIIFVLSISLCIISCKKEDTHSETKTTEKYNVVITYRGDQPIRSISYDKITNKKKFDYQYDMSGNMIYSSKYYDNGKIESSLKLDSLPYYYICEEYFPTGILAGEGNIIMLQKKKTLRTGPWIFYNEDGSVYAFAEFAVNKKEKKEILFKKEIIPKKYHLRINKNGTVKDDNKKGK